MVPCHLLITLMRTQPLALLTHDFSNRTVEQLLLLYYCHSLYDLRRTSMKELSSPIRYSEKSTMSSLVLHLAGGGSENVLKQRKNIFFSFRLSNIEVKKSQHG